jgi:regulator-associated protein of mTOR
MVRKELVTLLSCAVSEYRGWFIIAAWVYWEEEHDLEGMQSPSANGMVQEKTRTALYEWLEGMSNDEDFTDMYRLLFSSIFTIFVALLDLTLDPYPEVSAAA